MTKNILEVIKQEKFISIARGLPLDVIPEVVQALYDGGITLLEFTFNQSLQDVIGQNREGIKKACTQMGERMRIGAGTVLSVAQVQAAADSGAEYIVSPNIDIDVIRETKRLGLVSIPGAMTPTEIMYAWNSGADMVKLFPADDLGYHYIRNITAPLSHIPLIATGGVNPDSIPEFFNSGVAGMGAGITIIKPELVESRDFAEITRLARQHIEAVKQYLKNK